jgi:regulatory protein
MERAKASDGDGRDRRRGLDLAVRALVNRERTEHELRILLERRRVGPDVIDDVVGALRAEGFVDDAGYARRFTDDRRLLDGWGNERIARDLIRRGIERELIDQALAGHGHDDELALAVELLNRRFRVPLAGDLERDKAWRMLVRRGYEPELAYAAVRHHEQGLRDAA